jgi:hypothetical protein
MAEIKQRPTRGKASDERSVVATRPLET